MKHSCQIKMCWQQQRSADSRWCYLKLYQ